MSITVQVKYDMLDKGNSSIPEILIIHGRMICNRCLHLCFIAGTQKDNAAIQYNRRFHGIILKRFTRKLFVFLTERFPVIGWIGHNDTAGRWPPVSGNV